MAGIGIDRSVSQARFSLRRYTFPQLMVSKALLITVLSTMSSTAVSAILISMQNTVVLHTRVQKNRVVDTVTQNRVQNTVEHQERS